MVYNTSCPSPVVGKQRGHHGIDDDQFDPEAALGEGIRGYVHQIGLFDTSDR